MKRVEKESVSVDVVKLKASLIGLIKLGDAVDESECKKLTSEQLRKLVYPQSPKDNLHQ